jgi:MFS family permease
MLSMTVISTNVLFGESAQLNARRKYHKVDDTHHHHHDDTCTFSVASAPTTTGMGRFLFGFMYEEEADNAETEDDLLYRSTVDPTTYMCNRLNVHLCLSLMLSSAATAVPVTLLTAIGSDLLATNHTSNASSAFAPRATAAAVLGTSVGKFLNGPMVDLFGARRTSAVYSFLLAISLVILACSRTVESAAWACFLVEFATSVQWPCVIVTLATHYRGNSSGMYEGGIYLTSLAARLGSLVGIPVYSILLRRTHWRFVALMGSWMSLMACSYTYLYIHDSPLHPDEPQNPIDQLQAKKWLAQHNYSRTQHQPQQPRQQEQQRQNPQQQQQEQRQLRVPALSLRSIVGWIHFVLQVVLLPSIRHVLCSGTFWLVALAHTGASMVRTSERILGTYLYDTSAPGGSLSQNRASGLAAFLSLGTLAGLVLAGGVFASGQERERKWLVSRLYMSTIAACYFLALIAIPSVRYALPLPPEAVTSLQILAITIAGFGIAVQ